MQGVEIMTNFRWITRTCCLCALAAVWAGAPGLALADEQEASHSQGTVQVSEPEWKYPQLAQVTLENAIERALSAVPGQALEASLDEEDDFLVYAVKVVTPEHDLMEVIIDAGTGAVLSTEADVDRD
jgi:uncharacterized membrane protein YkoI